MTTKQKTTKSLGKLQQKIIDKLSFVEGMTAKQLNESLDVDLGSLQKSLRKLRKRGLVVSLNKSLLGKAHPQLLLWYLKEKKS